MQSIESTRPPPPPPRAHAHISALTHLKTSVFDVAVPRFEKSCIKTVTLHLKNGSVKRLVSMSASASAPIVMSAAVPPPTYNLLSIFKGPGHPSRKS